MKRRQKIWAEPPPLIWIKSKRTAFFSQDTFHEFRERICAFVFSLPFHRFGQKNWLKHNMWHFLHLFVYNKTNNDILKITSRSYCSWKITEYSISWKLTFEPFAMKYWAFCWTLHFVIYWSLSNLKQGIKFIASHENLTKMPNVDQRISDLSVWLYFASMCSPYI